MTVGEQAADRPASDRSAVRTLRRAEGIPAPVRLPPRHSDGQPAAPAPTADAAAPVVPVIVEGEGEPVPAEGGGAAPIASREERGPAAGAELGAAVGPERLAALLAVLGDPREVSRQCKDEHELGGSRTDTFTLPAELLQTLNRVCKERRIVKKWLVAALLEAVFEAWGVEVRAD